MGTFGRSRSGNKMRKVVFSLCRGCQAYDRNNA